MRQAGRCGARREGPAHARDTAKSIQGKPNKTKEKSLFFLGFLLPNRAFSMGYGKSKEKNFSPFAHAAARTRSQPCGRIQRHGNASTDSVFRKQKVSVSFLPTAPARTPLGAAALLLGHRALSDIESANRTRHLLGRARVLPDKAAGSAGALPRPVGVRTKLSNDPDRAHRSKPSRPHLEGAFSSQYTRINADFRSLIPKNWLTLSEMRHANSGMRSSRGYSRG